MKRVILAAVVGTSALFLAACSPTKAADQVAAATPDKAPDWQWTSRGAGGGGAFFAPSFNPKNPDDMWVTSDMGPVLHTTNLQKPDREWSTMHFTAFQGGRYSHVRFTSDPKILYALDGTKKGPIKSMDGGANWKKIEGWKDEAVVNMYADPNSSTRLLVATKDHLFLSTDGGEKFTSVFDSEGVYVGGVFFDTADKPDFDAPPSSVYVGTNRGLLKSTNDGAFEVQKPALPDQLEMISFAGAKDAKTGTVRLMCAAGAAGKAKPGANIEGITPGYKAIYSLDLGKDAWVDRSAGITDGYRMAFIGMAAGNIKTIFAAGASGGGGPLAVFKIADAEKEWKWASVFQTKETGSDSNKNVYTGWEGDGGDRGFGFDGPALDFELDLGNVNYAAVTGDGFVHYTSDGGATWHQAYVDPADENPANTATPKSKAYRNVGLNDTAVHYLAWADEKTIFAGYTDIQASRSIDGGRTWAIPNPANLVNTQYRVETAPNGTMYAANSGNHDIYQTWTRRGEGRSGALIMSTDKGASWKPVHKFEGAAVWEALDRNDASLNTMYVSISNAQKGGIYKTTNLQEGEKSTWEKLPAPPRTEGHSYNIQILKDGTIVTSWSCHSVNNQFTASSGVFVSTDGGKTWQDRTDPKMQYYTKDITIDPTDPKQNTWFAAVRNGFGEGPGGNETVAGLYKTTNRGQSWTEAFSMSGADGGVESCTINPATKEIFITTEGRGLYWAPDCTAAELKVLPTNYPYMHPYRVFINPYDAKDIWIVSYGNGISEAKAK